MSDDAVTGPRHITRVGATWVLPVSSPPIRDGRVAVEDGRIVWVGRRGDPGEPEGPLVELGNGVLLPGLVNAHTHLELSALAGATHADDGFVGWVRSLVEARPTVPPDTSRWATEQAIAAVIDSGTAAVGDVSNALGHLDLLSTAPLDAVVFLEIIGWDPDRAEAAIEEAQGRRRAVVPRGRVEVRIAAHTPQSVSPRLLSLMAQGEGIASIHLAESPEEVEFLRSGRGAWKTFLDDRGLGRVPFDPPGRSPVAYLESLGVLWPGLMAVHCVQVDRSDLALLARRGVKVIVCPRSNRTLGVGRAPVPAMLEEGLTPGLGTDSLASASSLDVIEEAVALHNEFPQIRASTLLRMATRGGAEALGISDLGHLAVGFRASLAFAPASEAVGDPEGFLVSGEARTERVDLP